MPPLRASDHWSSTVSFSTTSTRRATATPRSVPFRSSRPSTPRSTWHGTCGISRRLSSSTGPSGSTTSEELQAWLSAQDTQRTLTVFVGASSRETPVKTSLVGAQVMRAEIRPDLVLGGVAIPERHARNGEEHLRLLAKQVAGCSFFVTQVVYDANAAKNLVSDYYYECLERPAATPVPIIFTLSVCGSVKTMRFLNWLGVDLPRWLENELVHADDTLQASLDYALATAADLIAYCRALGIPFGFNVESVSIRRDEIDASMALAARLKQLLRRAGDRDSTR